MKLHECLRQLGEIQLRNHLNGQVAPAAAFLGLVRDEPGYEVAASTRNYGKECVYSIVCKYGVLFSEV